MAVSTAARPRNAVRQGQFATGQQRKPRPTNARDQAVGWKVSVALLLALAVTSGGLHVLFRNQSWWLVVLFVTGAVLAAAAATRALTRRRFLPPVLAVAVLIGLLTLLFARGSALFGVLPTFGTLDGYRTLFTDASTSIYRQAIPARADVPIVFVLCLGIGGLAVLCDLVANTFRLPALVGIPLLVILGIPALTARDITDPFVFALAAAAYLLVLVAGMPRQQPGLAAGIGAVAIVGALVLPVVLPGIDGSTGNGAAGLSSGVNPVLGLGDDLRRASARTVLDYTTESGSPHYLRLVSLENFTGDEWAPTEHRVDTGNSVDGFGPVPGLSESIATTAEETSVDVGSLSSRWLPVPYPPRVITGLDQDWFWEPDGFSVSSPDGTARGQEYTVESLLLQPTPEQLLAAGTKVSSGLEPYLDLPTDLPSVISDTAAEVAAAAGTNYEKALALQEFFRSGAFAYSEEAPVEGDYDGTGMEIIAKFLDVRAGYCVHFASSMAVMARSLHIPARVIVGFLPGTPTTNTGDQGPSFEVTTHDLHTWPELYFDGIGWVQFEPTPGRGELGDYADVGAAGVPAPQAPDAPAPGATPTPSPSATASQGPDSGLDAGSASSGSANSLGALGMVLLAVVAAWALSLVPALIRRIRRRRLAARLGAGAASAIDAWKEVLSTAIDLRLPVLPTETPRETARTIGGGRSIATLLAAVESEGYSATTITDSRNLARNIDDVRAALYDAAPPKTRLAATLYPASIWRWVAHPFRPRD